MRDVDPARPRREGASGLARAPVRFPLRSSAPAAPLRPPQRGPAPGARPHTRLGAREGGSGYSSMVLYINSSSSRATRFLWTRRFFPMLARSCVAAKPVRRTAQSPGLADNNFGLAPSSVDNQQVVPQRPPGLSTNAAPGGPHAWPQSTKPGVQAGLRAWRARRGK
jgi:hypothetical protein